MDIGVHVCEICGRVYATLGPYWDCQLSHSAAELAQCGAELRSADPANL